MFSELWRTITSEPLQLESCPLEWKLLKKKPHFSSNSNHFRLKLAELFTSEDGNFRFFRFSTILVTSLWAAGVSDQLPVSGFGYGGKCITARMAAFFLVFAYFRSGGWPKVANKIFRIPNYSTSTRLPWILPHLTIGFSDDLRPLSIPITKSVVEYKLADVILKSVSSVADPGVTIDCN